MYDECVDESDPKQWDLDVIVRRTRERGLCDGDWPCEVVPCAPWGTLEDVLTGGMFIAELVDSADSGDKFFKWLQIVHDSGVDFAEAFNVFQASVLLEDEAVYSRTYFDLHAHQDIDLIEYLHHSRNAFTGHGLERMRKTFQDLESEWFAACEAASQMLEIYSADPAGAEFAPVFDDCLEALGKASYGSLVASFAMESNSFDMGLGFGFQSMCMALGEARQTAAGYGLAL